MGRPRPLTEGRVRTSRAVRVSTNPLSVDSPSFLPRALSAALLLIIAILAVVAATTSTPTVAHGTFVNVMTATSALRGALVSATSTTAASAIQTPAPSVTATPSAPPVARIGCDGIFPLSGEWLPANAPDKTLQHYAPHGGCKILELPAAPPFSPAVTSCLKSRRVTILGNSVARGLAFELNALTGGAAPLSREQQKAVCPKVRLEKEVHADAAEGCVLTQPGLNLTVSFHWFLYFDNPTLSTLGITDDSYPASPPNTWELDICGRTETSACLNDVGVNADSSPEDVLLFNFGIVYGSWMPILAENYTGVGLEAWWLLQVRLFSESLKASGFRGRVVYVNQNPLRTDKSKSGNPDLVVHDQRIARFNEVVMPWMIAETNWVVLDVASVARPVVYTPLYADVVHIPGHLSRVVWHIIAGALCTALGGEPPSG